MRPATSLCTALNGCGCIDCAKQTFDELLVVADETDESVLRDLALSVRRWREAGDATIPKSSDAGDHCSGRAHYTMLSSQHDGKTVKLKFLHDRLLAWVSAGVSESQGFRDFHIGVLMVHLQTIDDLMGGIQVYFVWKPHKVVPPSCVMEPPPSYDEFAATPCTVALSFCFAELEMHHSHEVKLFLLSHIAEVCVAADSGLENLDERCVVLTPIYESQERQMILRFHELSQVKPFVAVVVSLASLCVDGADGCRLDPSMFGRELASGSVGNSSASTRDGTELAALASATQTIRCQESFGDNDFGIDTRSQPGSSTPGSTVNTAKANTPFLVGGKHASSPADTPRAQRHWV
eukprot:TRINITY_DN65772_c0_g1_i1.p1 TRINITY_DN65772_c0_g1~~TRINITY_DN65772_c0_g1_i1.p1  ORF type:complete len:350 (+),score=46.42 TRINITY_DN65772_c0_g1_i1:97-1146(+)